MREYFGKLQATYRFADGGKYLLIVDDTNVGDFLGHVVRTDFLASTQHVYTVGEWETPKALIENLKERAPDYDYLLITTQNEPMLDSLSELLDSGVLPNLRVYFNLDLVQ